MNNGEQPNDRKEPTAGKEESHDGRYEKTWGTPIGQDCINLNTTLASWLGERLVFLADHTTTIKPEADEPWSDALRRNGLALQCYAKLEEQGELGEGQKEAEQAMEWIAKNFRSFWE